MASNDKPWSPAAQAAADRLAAQLRQRTARKVVAKAQRVVDQQKRERTR